MSDYISRETAIAFIREQSEEMSKAFEELGGESGIYADAYNDLAEYFYRVPAADVEPVRRGWWKTFDSSYWRSTQYGVQEIDCVKIRCGLCGRGSAVRTNYCPNCGAKMDLEAENDG